MPVSRGRPSPLGAEVSPGGVNFSVYSKHATGFELLLFDRADSAVPSRIIELDPGQNRTFRYWHAFVRDIGPGQIYAFRARGPWVPDAGLRFDPDKVLLDPYGKLVAVPPGYDRIAAAAPGPNTATAMKSVVVDPSAYDWEGDEPLQRPFSRTIIYEMHVAGFTKHPSSGLPSDRRGTYAGLVEKIPYLVDLGVTAVELMPVFQFDPQDAPTGRINYWGYSPVSFFAPHTAFSSRKDLLGPLDEFRDMVKALHRAGIEVILDVVYNHTSEGNRAGPTQCFRGIDNPTYYTMEDGGRYANYAGTGNTFNATNSVVRRLIQDSLRYWVQEMHVDGFRFDLASILSRDAKGRPLEEPWTLYTIETDPALATAKLIAEPWDAAGLYQVGSFVGDRWKEWNGRYRDDIRAFVKGDAGMVPCLRDRLLASPDIYSHEEREPEQSINFVTCHDGFTLNDLVSYNEKHNEANGENNRDGHNHNLSWNHGVEGPTDDPAIDALRERQMKNFFLLLLASMGVPMLLMGDEVRRTQHGNNNAYAQDNETSWFDWRLVEKHRDLHRFTKLLLEWRLHHSPETDQDAALNEFLRQAHIDWHGVRLYQPDWSHGSRSLAVTVRGRGQHVIHAIFNSYWGPLDFELPPPPPGHRWRRLVDTSRPSPEDIYPVATAPLWEHSTYRVEARSSVVLID